MDISISYADSLHPAISEVVIRRTADDRVIARATLGDLGEAGEVTALFIPDIEAGGLIYLSRDERQLIARGLDYLDAVERGHTATIRSVTNPAS